MNRPTFVSTYNNDISRLSLKAPTYMGGVGKQAITANIRAMDKSNQAKLLSKLVAIKYYRQTGVCCFNNVEDVGVQNQLWGEIQKENLLPPNTELPDLMAFIKNDGYIVQRKLPSELQELLNTSEQQNVISNFNPKDRNMMCEFLADATGQIWKNSPTYGSTGAPANPLYQLSTHSSGGAHGTAIPGNNTTTSTSSIIRLAGTTQRGWAPFKQTRNNFNCAALCTTAQILGKGIPAGLSTPSKVYETEAERQTRTPDGFIEVAIQNGLANAKALTISSVEEYRRHIKESLREGVPLIAPFLVDGGLVLEPTRSMDYLPHHNFGLKGGPITKPETVTEMGQPIQQLIQQSSSFDAFKTSVEAYNKMGDSRIPETILTIPPHIQSQALTKPSIVLELRKPIRETQWAVQQFGPILDDMTEETFQALKTGSMSIEEFVVSNDLAHSCVITAFNPHDDKVTIAHWNKTYTTTAKNLFASSQLLPKGLQGILYTFHAEASSDSLESL